MADVGSNIQCPECSKVNAARYVDAFIFNKVEYKCSCGYYLYVCEWSNGSAMNELMKTIEFDRQMKQRKCDDCGE